MNIKRFVLGDIRSNCYVVYQDKTALVIDPGFESSLLYDFLKHEQLTVTHIYLTHGHFDHIGGVPKLKSIYKEATVYAPKADQVFFDPKDGISKLDYKVDADIFIPKDAPFTFNFEGLTFHVIHTPGHSFGSTCLYTNGILFSGDTLFRQTVGRTDLYLSSFADIKSSILNKLYILPDDTICYPGHGYETTIGFEKNHNAFVRIGL